MYGDEIVTWLQNYEFLYQAFAGIYSIENLPKAKNHAYPSSAENFSKYLVEI
jgi:hypothetical protein